MVCGVCVCVCVCMYVYMYICVYMCACSRFLEEEVCIYVCVCVCVDTYLDIGAKEALHQRILHFHSYLLSCFFQHCSVDLPDAGCADGGVVKLTKHFMDGFV